MRRMRMRWLSTLATVALLAAMVPAIPASGGVPAEGGAQVPAKATTVLTHQGPDGLRLDARGFDKDATLDFYRSETAGVLGTKINSTPVKGTSFVDATALVGVQYFYTAKVAGAPSLAARRPATESPQVKARVMEAKNAPKARKPASNEVKSPKPAKGTRCVQGALQSRAGFGYTRSRQPDILDDHDADRGQHGVDTGWRSVLRQGGPHRPGEPHPHHHAGHQGVLR